MLKARFINVLKHASILIFTLIINYVFNSALTVKIYNSYLSIIKFNIETYKDNLNCFNCFDGCLFCTGPLSTNCWDCTNGLLLYNNSCVEKCPDSLFTDKFNMKCQVECPVGLYNMFG